MARIGGRFAPAHVVYWAALSAVVVAVAGIEFALVPTGIWRDEATSYFESALPTIGLVLDRVRISEINPPLFFIVLHIWIAMFGGSTFAMRLLPYTISLVTLGMVFALARRTGDRSAVLLGMTFVGANAIAVTTASELRPYALATLLVLTSVLATERYISTGRARYLAIVTTANVLLPYTTYVGSVAIVAIAIAGALLLRARAATIGFAALAGLVPFVCALPLLPLEHAQAASNLVTATSLNLRPGDFLSFASRALPAYTLEPRRPQMLCGAVTVAVLLLALVRYGRKRGPDRSELPLVLAAGVFLLAVAGTAAVGLETPRYISPVVPLGALALGLAAARAIGELRLRHAGVASAALCLAVVGLLFAQAAIVGRIARLPKTSLEAIAAAYPTRASTSLALVVAPDFSAQSLAYYEGTTYHVYGFARWDRPEVFDLRGYDTLWRSPTLVADTLARIAGLKRAGVKRLVVVRIEPKYTGLPVTGDKYRLVDEMLRQLTRRYGAAAQIEFPAQVEDSTANVYRI